MSKYRLRITQAARARWKMRELEQRGFGFWMVLSIVIFAMLQLIPGIDLWQEVLVSLIPIIGKLYVSYLHDVFVAVPEEIYEEQNRTVSRLATKKYKTIQLREENYAGSTYPDKYIGMIVKNISGDAIDNTRATLVGILLAETGEPACGKLNVNAALRWSWTHTPEDINADLSIPDSIEYKVDIAVRPQTVYMFGFCARDPKDPVYVQGEGKFLIKILVSADYRALDAKSVTVPYFARITLPPQGEGVLRIEDISRKEYEDAEKRWKKALSKSRA